MASFIEYGLPSALLALQSLPTSKATAAIIHFPLVMTDPGQPVDPGPAPDVGGLIIGTPEAPTAGL